MAQEQIGIGGTPNDSTGDSIRESFTKVNNNATDAENRLALLETLSFFNFVGGGEWDANTNTPDAATTLVNDGDAMRVSVSGSTLLDGISKWSINDFIYKGGGQIRKQDSGVHQDEIIVSDPSDLAQFLNVGKYELPAGRYIFDGDLDFGTNQIDLVTPDGFYTFKQTNINSITYTGVDCFICNTATGVALKWDDGFLICPNGTGIEVSNGNSLILTLMVFVCKKAALVTSFGFVTLNDIPIVFSEDGLELINCGTTTAKLLQLSDGLDLGGTALTVSGASSKDLLLTGMLAKPTATESFLDIQANFGGDVAISSGIYSTGGGAFFKGASRDQTDVDIRLQNVKNVKTSGESASAYIAAGSEVQTTLSAPDTATVISGVWTPHLLERFTVSAAGVVTYTGKEEVSIPITFKAQVAPDSGSNQPYEIYVRVNGTTLDLQSRDTVTPDSGNPEKAVMITELTFNTDDYFEIVILGVGHSIDVDLTSVSLVV